MGPETFVELIEEMISLKIEQNAESRLKATPEVARVLQAKRETDRRRLEQIKAELIRILST